MKKSLSHLPAEKRDDLRFIAQCVVEELGDLCEMVILYGSYARGDYVEYDQRTEYGIRTYYMSDYDFLVITGRSLKYHRLGRALNRVTEPPCVSIVVTPSEIRNWRQLSNYETLLT